MIAYRIGNDLDLDEVLELYRASTLGARRPIDDRARMKATLQNANLVVTAWEAARLVGIARSLSDFSYATYLSDLAVRLPHQKQAAGRARRPKLLPARRSVASPASMDTLAR